MKFIIILFYSCIFIIAFTHATADETNANEKSIQESETFSWMLSYAKQIIIQNKTSYIKKPTFESHGTKVRGLEKLKKKKKSF